MLFRAPWSSKQIADSRKKQKAEEKEILFELEKEEKENKINIERTISNMQKILKAMHDTVSAWNQGTQPKDTNSDKSGKGLFDILQTQQVFFDTSIEKFNTLSANADADPYFIKNINETVRAFRNYVVQSLQVISAMTDKLKIQPLALFNFTTQDFESAFEPILETTYTVSRLRAGGEEELDPNGEFTKPRFGSR